MVRNVIVTPGPGFLLTTRGDGWYEDLFGPVRNDDALLEQMWRDAESELDEEDGKVWAVATVFHEGRWVAGAWAAAVEREEDGEPYLLCCNSYEVPQWRGKGLYARAFEHRQRYVVQARGIPARTWVFDQPRPLHEALGWKVVDTGVSWLEGLDAHPWFEMRWTPRVTAPTRSEPASRPVA